MEPAAVRATNTVGSGDNDNGNGNVNLQALEPLGKLERLNKKVGVAQHCQVQYPYCSQAMCSSRRIQLPSEIRGRNMF